MQAETLQDELLPQATSAAMEQQAASPASEVNSAPGVGMKEDGAGVGVGVDEDKEPVAGGVSVSSQQPPGKGMHSSGRCLPLSCFVSFSLYFLLSRPLNVVHAVLCLSLPL